MRRCTDMAHHLEGPHGTPSPFASIRRPAKKKKGAFSGAAHPWTWVLGFRKKNNFLAPPANEVPTGRFTQLGSRGVRVFFCFLGGHFRRGDFQNLLLPVFSGWVPLSGATRATEKTRAQEAAAFHVGPSLRLLPSLEEVSLNVLHVGRDCTSGAAQLCSCHGILLTLSTPCDAFSKCIQLQFMNAQPGPPPPHPGALADPKKSSFLFGTELQWLVAHCGPQGHSDSESSIRTQMRGNVDIFRWSLQPPEGRCALGRSGGAATQTGSSPSRLDSVAVWGNQAVRESRDWYDDMM